MENNKIVFPELFFTDKNLVGRDVLKISRNLSDLKGIFADAEAFERMPQNQLAYEVSSFLPEKKELRADCTSALPICIRGKSAMST